METNWKSGGGNALGLASIALPGQKLATSKSPRMLTPSETALLQQDLKAALSVVGLEEIEDAQSLIKDHRLPVEDFEFIQQPDPSRPGLSFVSGTVVCRRKSTGKARNYSAGHTSEWLKHLENDLKAGVFGH